MTTTYLRPVKGGYISDDFDEHKARHSVNPGTDFAVPAGTDVIAPAAGKILVADSNPDGAGGRCLVIGFDNGFGMDMLHFSSLLVRRGQHVAQGQHIAESGASAYGSNYGVGTHVHVSFRHNHSTSFSNVGNLDFDKYLGKELPSANSAIKWDQTRLNVWAAADGVAKIKVDGIPGKEYVGRVKSFQRRHGLVADGIAGAKTDAKLSLTPPGTKHPTIKRGSTGTHVTIWQRFLKTNYPAYAGDLVIDAVFGPRVEADTKEWQYRSGLVADGVVGPKSWAKAGI